MQSNFCMLLAATRTISENDHGDFDAETLVTSEDVAFLCQFLYSSSHKWRDIGVALSFQAGEMESFNQTNQPQQQLNLLLDKWSHWPTTNHPHRPTMEKLRDALRSGLVGLGADANELYSRRNFLPSRQRFEQDKSVGNGH